MTRFLKIVPLAVLAGVLVGCGGGSTTAETPTTTTVPEVNIPIDAPAGIPVGVLADPKPLLASETRAAMRAGHPRSDPFALRSDERQYETRQEAERIIGTLGGFSDNQFQPRGDEQKPAPVIEPQPYRRLAGIVVGDSVLALIDMGNGTTELVRPGQKIPGTEWTVVSIDEEKAVLRRSGNVLPHQITVRLELPPPGMGGAPGGGFQPGGAPGAPSGAPGAAGAAGAPGSPGGSGSAG